MRRTGNWRVGALPIEPQEPEQEPPADAVEPVAGSGRMSRVRSVRITDDTNTTLIVAFFAAHIPLALLMDRAPTVATVHAVAVFAIGAWLAVGSPDLTRVAMVTAYIAGAEVLWRMTGAQVYWEAGKYACAGIMLLALLRHKRLLPPLLPLTYFALLLPSAALTLANQEPAAARDQISFNLSGPFAVLMCAWFFSNVRLSARDLRAVFIAAIGPAIGVAALAAAGIFARSEIVFYDSSNMAASGGFGPNQVSAVLGFGALLALFVALDSSVKRLVQFVMGGVVIGLAAQSALTFSRGGLYGAGGGAIVAACFFLRGPRLSFRLVPLVVVFFVIGNYFVYPYLDAFTGGQIGIRFQDTRLTGREQLIRADIELWKENPIFGVGPGEGRAERGAFFVNDGGLTSTAASGASRGIAAHTEFSRLLSEHGAFGLGALVLFGLFAIMNVTRATSVRTRAIAAGLAAWSILFMVSNAMRIVAPSFAIGVGFAALADGGTAALEQVGLVRLARRVAGSTRTLSEGHPALKERHVLGREG